MKNVSISVTINELLLVRAEAIGNRSLMDRTPDSDSGNAGSIPAGCIRLDTTGTVLERYGG